MVERVGCLGHGSRYEVQGKTVRRGTDDGVCVVYKQVGRGREQLVFRWTADHVSRAPPSRDCRPAGAQPGADTGKVGLAFTKMHGRKLFLTGCPTDHVSLSSGKLLGLSQSLSITRYLSLIVHVGKEI